MKRFDSENYLISLPNGDVCLALAWSGDSTTVQARDEEAHKDIRFGFFIPRESSLSWFDKHHLPKGFSQPLEELPLLCAPPFGNSLVRDNTHG